MPPSGLARALPSRIADWRHAARRLLEAHSIGSTRDSIDVSFARVVPRPAWPNHDLGTTVSWKCSVEGNGVPRNPSLALPTERFKMMKQSVRMRHDNIALSLGFAAWTMGCAADPGTQPHDMSTAQHEAMAKNEESAASGHAGRGSTQKEVGATVVFRAVPGMTAEWLQRVVDCHLARAAAVGHDMPEMSYCPLMPNGVKAKVTSVGNGFAVNLSADDAATVAEIQKRAQALAPGGEAPLATAP